MTNREINIIELAIAMLLCAAMVVASLYPIGVVMPLPTGDYGICLPSPACWSLTANATAMVNGACVVLIALALVFFNKHYNVIQNMGLAPSIVFVCLCTAFPWMLISHSSAALAALLCLVLLWMDFEATRQRQPAAIVFITGLLLSLASMMQYGFMLLMPVWLIIGFALHIMTLRSLPAFLAGIIAPYWCALGTGLVSIEQLRMPDAADFMIWGFSTAEGLWMLVFLGCVALLILLLALSNIIRLYSSKRHIRNYHQAITILGLSMPVLMLVNFSNILFYSATMLMCAGLECGYVMNASRHHRTDGWLILLMVATTAYAIWLLVA